jgi:GxxExxY protein
MEQELKIYHRGTENTEIHDGGITQKYINAISFKIIGCAIEVHRHLGPGLMESVYEPCLIEECLSSQGLDVKSQVWVPVHYKTKKLGGKLKLDLLIMI